MEKFVINHGLYKKKIRKDGRGMKPDEIEYWLDKYATSHLLMNDTEFINHYNLSLHFMDTLKNRDNFAVARAKRKAAKFEYLYINCYEILKKATTKKQARDNIRKILNRKDVSSLLKELKLTYHYSILEGKKNANKKKL